MAAAAAAASAGASAPAVPVVPKTMRAWIVAKNGSPRESLALKPEWPTSATGVGTAAPTGANMVVRVTHAALNPADLHFMKYLPAWLPFRRHPVPGLDFAGEVVQAGPAVESARGVGTAVAGAMSISLAAFGTGTLAEYVSVPADLVGPQPAGMAPGAAAGLLGIAGQTAAFVVQSAGGLRQGDRVLINGASGGVGSILLQVCKGKGAVVSAVCSGANADMVKRLGADEFIDYTAHKPLTTHLAATYEKEPFDFVFDTVGDQSMYAHSPKYLKPKGEFISIVGGGVQGVSYFVRSKLLPTFLGGTPRTYKMLSLAPSGTYAREAAEWATKGWVKEVPIDSEYPMEGVVEAYEKLMTRRAKGKIIIKVQAEQGK